MSMNALPSKDKWIKMDKDYVIRPTNSKRPRDRPKKKRMKSIDEVIATKASKREHKYADVEDRAS